MTRVPNIPAVSSSIVENSFTAPVFSNGRTVLIPFISKYGKEEILEYYGTDEVKYKLGSENSKRYGKSLQYVNTYLRIPNVKIIGKRLCSANATLANFLIKDNGSNADTIITKPNVVDIDAELSNDQNNLIIAYGSGRGEGYNDLYIDFNHDLDMELFYSDDEGKPLYKFNFITADVYEKTPNGLVRIATDLKFSLIDNDPDTDSPITNPRTNSSLYINDVFEDNNEFIKLKLNEEKQLEINSIINIDKVSNKAPVIAETNGFGIKTGRYFKLEEVDHELRIFGIDPETVDENNVVLNIPVNKFVSGNTAKIEILSAPKIGTLRINNSEITVDKKEDIPTDVTDELYYVIKEGNIYRYNGATLIQIKSNKYYDEKSLFPLSGLEGTLYVDKSTGDRYIWDVTTTDYVKIKTNTTGDSVTDYIVDGNTAFYKLEADASGTKLVFENNLDAEQPTSYDFVRYGLFHKLTSPSVNESEYNGKLQLQNGSDGDLVDANGRYNVAEAKSLIIGFYNDTEEIKEILYPKYDFDYLIDTEVDYDIGMACSNLAQNLGTALSIIGLPYANSYDDDIEVREKIIYMSNMHAAIYSGQHNTKFYDVNQQKYTTMPLSYFALQNHLTVDNTMSITEPVANTDKGAMLVSGYTASYEPSSLQLEKLRQRQINTLNIEKDGIYLLTQETAYKRNGKLSKINNVKTLHRVRKDLPALLKDLLQLKSTSNIINEAVKRTEYYMERWTVREDNLIDGIFEEVVVTPHFDEASNTLYLYLNVKFIGIIERINIPIIVK